jgi:hypothetical protein
MENTDRIHSQFIMLITGYFIRVYLCLFKSETSIDVIHWNFNRINIRMVTSMHHTDRMHSHLMLFMTYVLHSGWFVFNQEWIVNWCHPFECHFEQYIKHYLHVQNRQDTITIHDVDDLDLNFEDLCLFKSVMSINSIHSNAISNSISNTTCIHKTDRIQSQFIMLITWIWTVRICGYSRVKCQ